jgi:hypothetical protein
MIKRCDFLYFRIKTIQINFLLNFNAIRFNSVQYQVSPVSLIRTTIYRLSELLHNSFSYMYRLYSRKIFIVNEIITKETSFL